MWVLFYGFNGDLNGKIAKINCQAIEMDTCYSLTKNSFETCVEIVTAWENAKLTIENFSE